MAGRWWRAYDEAVDDPKLIALSDAAHRAWFNILCLSSANGGAVPSDKILKIKLRLSSKKLEKVLDELRQAGLFDTTEDGLETPHNWGKRQYQSDTSTPRVKRFREKQRNVSVTPPDNRVQSTETEKKKEPSLRSAPALNPDWPDDAFEQFYAAYPRKTEKLDAQKALEKVRKKHRVPWPDLIGAVARYAAVADPQFTKHPSTWLNKGCWADQQQKNGHRPANSSRKSNSDDFFAGLAEAAADIPRDGGVARPAVSEIPLGRFNIDGH